jgi:hypothetical protein
LDGRPLPGALVEFWPTAANPKLQTIACRSDADGHLTMLRDPRRGCEPGPGKYVALVRLVGRAGASDRFYSEEEFDRIALAVQKGGLLISAVYQDKLRSPLQVTIGRGENDLMLDLKTKR